MKHKYNKRLFAVVYAAAGVFLLTGFTSLAAESTGPQRWIQADQTVYAAGQQEDAENISWNFTDTVTRVNVEALDYAKTSAEEAHEAYLEKLEEEKARKEAEEAEKAARQAEKELLASLIFCEAGNQPYEGQVAVGAVVMNRVRSGQFPDTVRDVIYESGQFTPAMTGWLDSVLSRNGYTDSAMQAAEDALSGSNPVGNCLYFSTGKGGYKLGDHYFR